MKDVPEAFNVGLLFFSGPTGLLRASRRAIDHSLSWHPQYPHHPHDKDEKIAPGTIVELEIGIWAIGNRYEAGESLRLSISGCNPTWTELRDTEYIPRNPEAESAGNKGQHTIHFGGQYPSRLILPFVPLLST